MSFPRGAPYGKLKTLVAREDLGRFKHNEELYFDDGNIILIVENWIAFRVHASVLSMHSEYFDEILVDFPGGSLAAVGRRPSSGMLLPHLEDARKKQTYDGCPLLKLPEENVAAVRSLLGAFYRCKDTDSELTIQHPDNVLRVLPISYRYEVTEIFQTCVSLVKEMNSTWYPGGYTKWQLAPEKGWAPLWRTCAFIETMREVKCTALVPAAFYALVCHKTEDVLEHLDKTEVVRFMVGREHLRNALFARVAAWRASDFSSGPECPTSIECARAAANLKMRLYKTYESLFAPQTQGSTRRKEGFVGYSPGFNIFKILHTVASEDRQLCERCSTDFLKCERVEAKLLWKRLPVIFDIGPDWKSLKKL